MFIDEYHWVVIVCICEINSVRVRSCRMHRGSLFAMLNWSPVPMTARNGSVGWWLGGKPLWKAFLKYSLTIRIQGPTMAQGQSLGWVMLTRAVVRHPKTLHSTRSSLLSLPLTFVFTFSLLTFNQLAVNLSPPLDIEDTYPISLTTIETRRASHTHAPPPKTAE